MKKTITLLIILSILLTGCGLSKTADSGKTETAVQTENKNETTQDVKDEIPTVSNPSTNTPAVLNSTSKPSGSTSKTESSTFKPETPEVKPQTPTAPTKPETPSKKGHYENVLVKEAYDEQVLVKEAWDENILIKDGYSEQVLVKEAWTETVKGKCATYSRDIIGNYECTVCGAIFMEAGDASRHAIEEGSSYNNTTTYAGEYHCVEWRPDTTVDHPAEYKTVYHDPEYKVIHHEAEYKTVHHDAKYEQRWVED